jgi:protein SCO1/2
MKGFRVYRAIRREPNVESYLVDHTAIVYLMGPDGTFVTSFSHATSVADMTERLRRLL